MNRAAAALFLASLALPDLCAGAEAPPPANPEARHLANVRQLTFGGQNAEAYFSADGGRIIFQTTVPPYNCDQIFLMNADGSDVRLLSTGLGRTTCAYLFPDGKHFLYASTHLGGDECPAEPDRSKGFVWGLYPTFDIFMAPLDDPGKLTRLTEGAGYDAEAAVSPDGKKIVYTSLVDNDLDIWIMDADGSGKKRLTERKGFDGGPFFSWDGLYIVYRSHYPKTEEAMKEYEYWTSRNLMRPTAAEIWYMRADGSEKKQVTDTGDANWSPFMHPDDRRIIFSSNMHNPGKGGFSLYVVNVDGSGLERVTFGARFDSFPMFSRDGRKLIWCSTRNGKGPMEFNVFVADWIP